MPSRLHVDPKKALVILCMSAFLVPFMGSAINLALPEISDDLSLKAVTLTWLATAYLIPTAIFQIPFARIGDLFGRKKIFVLGIFLFSICTFLSGFASTGTALITLRFMAGLGSAMMFGSNIAILTSIFPPKQRGKALGINSATVYFSLTVGPLVGGFLTHYLGWQSIFFVCGIIGFIAVFLSFFWIKAEWIESKGEPFDYVGSILYGFSLFGVIFGFMKLPSVYGIACLVLGIAAFVGFVYYERHYSHPVFNLQLFSKNRVFALSSLAALINYAATSAIIFMLSLYLQYIRGFDARHAGLILITQAGIQSVFSLISGRMSDHFSPSHIATLGMAIIVISLLGLVFISPDTPISLLIVILLLLGIGFGIFSSPNTNVIMSSVEKKYYGQASATTGTMRLSGQAFSMGIAGMAIALKVGNEKITPEVFPEFMQSLRITFLVFCLLCIVGTYASSVRTKKK